MLPTYGSISNFDKKGTNETAQITSFNNPLKLFVSNDTIKNSLDFKLTKINRSLPAIRDKKVHNFLFTEIGTKRKKQMNKLIETVIVRDQQKFDQYDTLNPIDIEINDDRILSILRKHKNAYYKLTPIGVLFPSSVTNDTKQIFVTCRELNNAKVALINGKICSLLDIISLNKISNWEYKGKSLWVNISFNEQEQINDSKHLSFSFKTQSLNDLLNFSISLTDSDNKLIKFSSGEQKTSILNFKIEVFLK